MRHPKGGEPKVITLIEFLQSLRDREEGQTLVEYSLILALISIAAIAIMTTLGETIIDVFQDVIDALTGSGGGTGP